MYIVLQSADNINTAITKIFDREVITMKKLTRKILSLALALVAAMSLATWSAPPPARAAVTIRVSEDTPRETGAAPAETEADGVNRSIDFYTQTPFHDEYWEMLIAKDRAGLKKRDNMRDGGVFCFISPAEGNYSASWTKDGETHDTINLGRMRADDVIARSYGEDRADYLLTVESTDAKYKMEFSSSPGWDVLWLGAAFKAPFDIDEIEIVSKNGGWLRQTFSYAEGSRVLLNVPFASLFISRFYDACTVKLKGGAQTLEFPFAFFDKSRMQTVGAHDQTGALSYFQYYPFYYIQSMWYDYDGSAMNLNDKLESLKKADDLRKETDKLPSIWISTWRNDMLDLWPPDEFTKKNADSWAWKAIVTYTDKNYSPIGEFYGDNPWGGLQLKNHMAEENYWRQPATRWEAAVMLEGPQYNCFDDAAEEYIFKTQQFVDVPASKHYMPYVNELKRSGIVEGAPGGIFSPDAFITREEAAKMLYLYASTYLGGDEFLNKATEGWELPCNDADQISEWARSYVRYLYFFGIVNGSGSGAFEPKRQVTRQEMAAMVWRAEWPLWYDKFDLPEL
jgi:hypothetical protein